MAISILGILGLWVFWIWVLWAWVFCPATRILVLFNFVNRGRNVSFCFFQKGYIKLNSEVEFSIISTDSPDKQNAVRIKILGPGAQKKVSRSSSIIVTNPNQIITQSNVKSPLSVFNANINALAASPQPITAQSPITVASLADGETVTKTRGFISSILRNHGFVESEDHSSEYFFQTNTCVLPPDGALEVGDEVQFLLRTTDGKSIADNVTLLDRRTIQSMVSKFNVDTHFWIHFLFLLLCFYPFKTNS